MGARVLHSFLNETPKQRNAGQCPAPSRGKKSHMLERFSASSALNQPALKLKSASLMTNVSHLKKIKCDNDIHISADGWEAITLH